MSKKFLIGIMAAVAFAVVPSSAMALSPVFESGSQTVSSEGPPETWTTKINTTAVESNSQILLTTSPGEEPQAVVTSVEEGVGFSVEWETKYVTEIHWTVINKGSIFESGPEGKEGKTGPKGEKGERGLEGKEGLQGNKGAPGAGTIIGQDPSVGKGAEAWLGTDITSVSNLNLEVEFFTGPATFGHFYCRQSESPSGETDKTVYEIYKNGGGLPVDKCTVQPGTLEGEVEISLSTVSNNKLMIKVENNTNVKPTGEISWALTP